MSRPLDDFCLDELDSSSVFESITDVGWARAGNLSPGACGYRIGSTESYCGEKCLTNLFGGPERAGPERAARPITCLKCLVAKAQTEHP